MLVTIKKDKLEFYGGEDDDSVKVLFHKKDGKWFRIFTDKPSEETPEEEINTILKFIGLFVDLKEFNDRCFLNI